MKGLITWFLGQSCLECKEIWNGNKTDGVRPSWLTRSICAYHHVAPGSNPKHIIIAFSSYHLIMMWKDENKQKRGRDWHTHFKTDNRIWLGDWSVVDVIKLFWRKSRKLRNWIKFALMIEPAQNVKTMLFSAELYSNTVYLF